MLGIGKKKETDTAVTKKNDEKEASEIQFDFEEDDKLPFDDEDLPDEEFATEDFAAEPVRKGLPQRTLLLGLLLLLALGGGGYYYLNSTPAPPPPQPAAPVKTKVAVQPAQPVPAPVTAAKPASPVPVATPPAKASQPAAVTPPAPAAAAKPASAVPVAKVVPAATAPEAKSEAVAPATPQPFTLAAGAFLSQKHQREIVKKIRHLGYTPKVQTTYSMVPMTRLRLGVYDPATAQERSQELSAQCPDLFALKQGDKVALYAGSYQSLDQARSFADQLYLRGIHVDEETVSLRMPLKKVSFGSFASQTAAEKAAKRAAAAGLTAQVVKR
jgi:cell division septation protein DedD